MKNKLLNIIGVIAVVAAVVFAIQYKKGGRDMDAGIRIENMNLDQIVFLAEDFYEYATGGWQKLNPLPDDYSRYGTIEKLDKTNDERVLKIAENDTGKIGTLYKMIMDEDALNAAGTAPVQPLLAEIDAIKSRNELAAYIGRASKYMTAFWGDGVTLDEKDSEHFIYVIGQSGIGLSRDYFFDTDAKSVEIRTKYKKYAADQLKNFGVRADVEKLYRLEERMAKSFSKKEQLRDPHANYHKMSIAELKEQFPNFDWDAFLSARGATAATHINVAQPAAIKESIAIMNDTDLGLIRTYLKWRVIESAVGLVDEKTYDIAFNFANRVIAGQKEKKPRWRRAVDLLDGAIGEEIGRLYVKQYFPSAAKRRMQKLVENLRRAYAMRLEQVDWMSDETRNRALEKLAAIKVKIGYPDKWRDYSELHIDANLSLFENMMRVAEFEDAFWLAKIGTEKDPTIWYMNAHTVNAYYDPSTNEICFPAGILQYPFFDMNADDAFNYGAIGAVIGHEMTHGFDDQGRHYDKDGNLNDWWTPEDAARFVERANVMRDFFDKIKITDDVHANGTFTLGENLADYGGVTIAYTAYKHFGTPSEDAIYAEPDMPRPDINNFRFTPEMRFFIAYANVWAANIRPEEALRMTKTNEHSLHKNRVNGILPHVTAWYDAFSVHPIEGMYLPENERVKLW